MEISVMPAELQAFRYFPAKMPAKYIPTAPQLFSGQKSAS